MKNLFFKTFVVHMTYDQLTSKAPNIEDVLNDVRFMKYQFLFSYTVSDRKPWYCLKTKTYLVCVPFWECKRLLNHTDLYFWMHEIDNF